MTTEKLLEILYKAKGPSEEIDDLLWRFANDHKLGVSGREYDLHSAQKYTSSWDAAFSLMPPEHDWIVADVNGHMGGTPYAQVGPYEEHYGATPLLSLCIAIIFAVQKL